MKLFKLPDGNSIDPSTITSIAAYEAEDGISSSQPRVIVRADTNYVMPCDTFGDACLMRDRLVEAVNATRRP